MHEVLTERAAERDLRRLPSGDFERILAVIRALAADPRPPGSRKMVGSKSDWRIRIGTWRVIYEVDDEAEVVRIMRVGHRREVYR